MERELRALSERIRYIEGFDVVITRKKNRQQAAVGQYKFYRAALKKWSIDYWESKRNDHPFLQFNVIDPDGETISRTTPLEIPREFYKGLAVCQGEIVRIVVKCNSEAQAMQMRRELLRFGIDAEYKRYNFLWMSWHELKWLSPSLRMTVAEYRKFHVFLENLCQKLSCQVEIEHKKDESPLYLDECPSEYTYISRIEDLKS